MVEAARKAPSCFMKPVAADGSRRVSLDRRSFVRLSTSAQWLAAVRPAFAGPGGAAVAFWLLHTTALTLLAAELYNILAFHLTLAPASIVPALVAAVLWVVVFLQYRASFKDVLAAKPALEY